MDIVFLGIVVLLLVNRLRSVLGTRPPRDENAKDAAENRPNVVDISDYRTIEGDNGAKMKFDPAAAGAFEDALSSLPPLTSVGFFLFAAIAARSSLTPAPALFAAYPLYQLWLSVWIAESGGGVFWRTLAALPVGAAALVAVAALLFWVDGKAGVNERG